MIWKVLSKAVLKAVLKVVLEDVILAAVGVLEEEVTGVEEEVNRKSWC